MVFLNYSENPKRIGSLVTKNPDQNRFTLKKCNMDKKSKLISVRVILYSPKADKFYIGETHDIEKRIIAHNNHVYKKSFTHIANDWELFYKIECKNEQQAKQIEHHLKKMRNRKYYQNLKLYPAITKKLLEQYP